MEDKQYLDEAGLGEVGKVISKHYASKEDIKNIDVTKQLDDYAKKTNLDNKVDKVDGKSLSSNDYTDEDKKYMNELREKQDWDEFIQYYNTSLPSLLSGTLENAVLSTTHYCSNPDGVGVSFVDDERLMFYNVEILLSQSDSNKYKLLAQGKINPLGAGICVIQKLNQSFKYTLTDDEPCYITQTWTASSNGLTLSRITKEAKIEYSDNYLLQQWKKQRDNFRFSDIVSDSDWQGWLIAGDDTYPCSLYPVSPDSPQAGLMLPEDKKKLDSIDVEVINSLKNKSNINTIKICDVKKEILSKGADAPIGLYMNNTTTKPFLELYCVRRSPFNGTIFYDVNRLGQGAFFYNQLTEHYIWKDNMWQAMGTPSLTAESGSIYYQLNELAGRIDRLESAMRPAGLLAPEPAQ